MMIKSTIKTANNVNSILSCNCLNKRPLSASPPVTDRVIMSVVEVIVTDSLLRE